MSSNNSNTYLNARRRVTDSLAGFANQFSFFHRDAIEHTDGTSNIQTHEEPSFPDEQDEFLTFDDWLTDRRHLDSSSPLSLNRLSNTESSHSNEAPLRSFSASSDDTEFTASWLPSTTAMDEELICWDANEWQESETPGPASGQQSKRKFGTVIENNNPKVHAGSRVVNRNIVTSLFSAQPTSNRFGAGENVVLRTNIRNQEVQSNYLQMYNQQRVNYGSYGETLFDRLDRYQVFEDKENNHWDMH
ncbi:hypothetical protein WICPIJ_006106 [Wickerhamomyces pijperi]|uniref:Uncharacterized protein n=1 Tax=Wickerhamomyces pijperi TaxID=599730 RepID=A0A9P8Q2B0_WICPI|nr:hypothetical protein WICPIJ_006106 [Wickerhamomyces pijperi]